MELLCLLGTRLVCVVPGIPWNLEESRETSGQSSQSEELNTNHTSLMVPDRSRGTCYEVAGTQSCPGLHSHQISPCHGCAQGHDSTPMCSQHIPLWEALIHFSAHSQLGKKGTDPVSMLQEAGKQPALLCAIRTTANKPHIQQLAALTLRGNTPCDTKGNHRQELIATTVGSVRTG